MLKSDSRYAIAAAAMLALSLAAAPAFAAQAAPAPQNGPAAESGAAPAGSPSLPAGVDTAAGIQAFLSQFLGANGTSLSADQLAQIQQARAQAEQMAQQLTAQMKQVLESNSQNPGALPLPVLPDEAAAQLRQLLDSNGSGAVAPAIPDAGQISAMAEQFRQFLTASGLGAAPSPEELAARLESLKEKIGNPPNAAPAQNGAAPTTTAPAPPLPQWPQ